jgi:hypothetical protein
MSTGQLGIVITMFVVIVTAILIWDEVRAELRFRTWLDNIRKEKDDQE